MNEQIRRRASGVGRMMVVVLACGLLPGAANAAAQADASTIEISNFAFTPAVLTIKSGTRITFQNHDDIPHSIVEVAGKFRSRALDTDESFSVTVDAPGEIAYFCGLHPHMKGKIIVSP